MAQLNNTVPCRDNIYYNLTPPLQSFIGREEELSKLHELVLHESVPAMVTRVTCIFGAGGVGKSELARLYCHHQINFFKNIIFLNMEDMNVADESILELARKFNISLEYYMNKTAGFQDILRAFHKYFDVSDEKTLIVLDNSRDYKTIRNYVPKEHFFNKPYLLITSRHQEWNIGDTGDIELLQLKNFKPSESELYIEKELSIKCEKEMVNKLANEMYHFPLALRQAVSYINMQNNQKKEEDTQPFQIEDFISLYHNDKFTALSEFIEDNNYLYRETLLTIWNKVLEGIFQDEESGELSKLVFDMMAYLKPAMDVNELFLKLDEDEEVPWRAIELLFQFSFVSLKWGILRTEPIFQDIARYKIKLEGTEEKILNSTLKILENTNNCEVHVVNVWKYASQYPELIKTYFEKSLYSYNKVTPLHLLAEKNGNLEVIKTILECIDSDDIDFEDINNETALYKAAREGYIDVIEYLVSKGARLINQCTDRGWTVLHVAVHKNNEDLIRYFLSRGSFLETITDQCKWTPVDLAAFTGRTNLVKIFNPPGHRHEFFASLHLALHNKFPEFDLYLKKMVRQFPLIVGEKLVGVTPLHLAADGGSIEYVKILLQYGAFIDSLDNDGCTPLYHAVRLGYIELVKLFIEHKSNLNIVDSLSTTLLHVASKEYPDIVKLLIDNGADLYATDGFDNTPIHIASMYGNCGVFNTIMESASVLDVNCIDKYKQTPLHLATKIKSPNFVRMLLERGATINIQDNNGVTPLHNAATTGNFETVKLLMENGADHEIVDVYGRTPLQWAACKGKENILVYLIEHGADPNKNDIYGRAQLHYAAMRGHVAGARTLIERGGSPFAADKYDRTPLHDACEFGNADVVRYLLVQGLNPKATDISGRTPLHYAAECDRVKVANFLINTVETIEVDARDKLGKTPLYLAVSVGSLPMVKALMFSGADCNITNKSGVSPLMLASILRKDDIIAFMAEQRQ